MSTWTIRAISAEDGLRLPAHRVLDRDVARDADGRIWWLARPPALRHREPRVGQRDERPVDWRLVEDAGDVVLRVSKPGAEADIVELSGPAAEAFVAGGDEPLTAVGPYRALGGPRDLAEHISSGGPLLPAFGAGARRISEQLGLSLYRICRHRGGAFWDGAAGWLTEWSAARAREIEAQNELRFVTDLALLLLAARRPAAAEPLLDELERLSAPFGGGRWYRHDRQEAADGRNDLVLNTHLYALIALTAGGRSPAAGARALGPALALRAPRLPGAALAARITATDLLTATRLRDMTAAAWSLHERWAELRGRHPHLTLVPGLAARDTRPAAAGRYYRTVNLLDLAGAMSVAPTPVGQAALRDGVRLARAGGFFTAQRRAGAWISVMVPSLLRMAGRPRAAARTAEAVRAAGWAPAIGWPGYTDSLWERLPPGVP